MRVLVHTPNTQIIIGTAILIHDRLLNRRLPRPTLSPLRMLDLTDQPVLVHQFQPSTADPIGEVRFAPINRRRNVNLFCDGNQK